MKKKTQTSRDPARPLQKKKEFFCKLYTYEHWGDPIEAARKAGFETDPESLRKLLNRPEIGSRIRYLRQQISDQTVADEAWIKRCFIEIIKNADKPADKLRALATLYRTLAGQKKTEKLPEDEPEFNFDCDEEL